MQDPRGYLRCLLRSGEGNVRRCLFLQAWECDFLWSLRFTIAYVVEIYKKNAMEEFQPWPYVTTIMNCISTLVQDRKWKARAQMLKITLYRTSCWLSCEADKDQLVSQGH